MTAPHRVNAAVALAAAPISPAERATAAVAAVRVREGRGSGAVSWTDVLAATAAFYGQPTAAVLSASRDARLCFVRHVAVYLARELSGTSFPAIARRLRRRTHSAAWSSHRRIARLRASGAADIEADLVAIIGALERAAPPVGTALAAISKENDE